jgi:threonine synthase
VGAPSNLERLLAMAGSEDAARAEATATSVGDETIRDTIAAGPERYGQVFCPHTATAIAAWERMPSGDRRQQWIAVATAHPAKFEDVLEPLLGQGLAMPPAFAELLDRPRVYKTIPAELEALKAELF